MLSKRARFLTMMAASVGVPYAWFNENLSGSLRGTWQSLHQQYASFSGGQSPPASGSWSRGGANLPDSIHAGTGGAAVGPSFHRLDHVLRFDVTPRWIIQNWSRVSTVRADPNLEGLRVALTTGTGPEDLAGALTYYFDGHGQVRRLTFHGQTGDERQLVNYLQRQFRLQPEPALGAGMYVWRWNGKPVSVLRVAHAPVIRAHMPDSQLLVDLEINDPGSPAGLSLELAQKLQYEQQVRQWSARRP